MERPKLSQRLEKVLSACRRASCIADIGTDHGLLPIACVITGKADRAVACDLRKAPLERCRENVKRYGLEDRISLRLADGFDALQCGEADEVTISGMGGMLICQLVYKALICAKLLPGARLVLCPNTHDEYLRRMVSSACFANVRERALRDGGVTYLIISCEYIGGKPEFDYAAEGFDTDPGFKPEHFTGLTGKLPEYYYRKILEKAEKRLAGLGNSRGGNEFDVIKRTRDRCLFLLDTASGI